MGGRRGWSGWVRKIFHLPEYCPTNSKLLLHQLCYLGPQKVKQRSTTKSKLFYIFMLLTWKSSHPNMRMTYIWYIQLCYSAWTISEIFQHKNKYWNSWVHTLESNNTFYERHAYVGLFFKKKWNQGRDIQQAHVRVSSSMNILRLDIDICHYCQHLDLLILVEVVWYLRLAQHLHLVPLMSLQLCYWLLYYYVNYCQTVPVTYSQTS